MMNREEMILALRYCFLDEGKCEDCPMVDSDDEECRDKLIKRIIYKLEAESPIYKNDMPFCGECKYALARTTNYCPKCGRKVKWDD